MRNYSTFFPILMGRPPNGTAVTVSSPFTHVRSQTRTSPGLDAVLARFGGRVRLLRRERKLTREEAASQAKPDGKHFRESNLEGST